MYCASCGHPNDNNAYKCVACGMVLQGHPPAPDPTPTPPPAAPSIPSPAPAPASPDRPAQVTVPPPVPFSERPNVPNYLVWAILATLCCCLPGGIVAIVYASQVDGKLAAGDIAGAQASARSAATWCWVSAAVGLLAGCAYAGFVVLNINSSWH